MPINYEKPIDIRDGRNGGWFWVDKEVWLDEGLSQSDKVVYGTLAYFANNKNQLAFPSIDNISKYSSASKRQVYKSIKILEINKYIAVIRNHGKPNKYTLIDTAIQQQKQGGAKNARVQNSTSRGAIIAVKGVQNSTTNNTNIEQDLFNNKRVEENSSYKDEINRIATWAFTRARVTPSISRDKFCESVEKAIARVGYDAVHEEFANEENAINFLSHIKSL